jgi:hypothetical protein
MVTGLGPNEARHFNRRFDFDDKKEKTTPTAFTGLLA